MSTSNNGKTVALVILVVILMLLAFRSIFFVLPFGIFPGITHMFRDTGRTFWTVTDFGFLKLFPLVFLPLALLALWVYVIIWVYRDAERKGMNGLLWALLVLIGNIIGLIIYLIIRSESSAKPREILSEKCPSCGNNVTAGFTYCPNCGARLKPVCPGCQKPMDRSWKVCPSCGTRMDAEKSEPT
ncbi:MAG: zinc ribbon domain-containing protein [Candidatus Aminicenantales bacterium]